MYDEINQNKFVLDCERYIEENVAAPYIAFYLARGYSLDVLGTSSLKQHFNSAADVFNIYFENTDKVITDIKQILKEKYKLEIVEENPLKIKILRLSRRYFTYNAHRAMLQAEPQGS